jgi:hypothetical protein
VIILVLNYFICQGLSTHRTQAGLVSVSQKAERLPTLGSREEVEGGVKHRSALRAPLMTAAIIRVLLAFLLAQSVP